MRKLFTWFCLLGILFGMISCGTPPAAAPDTAIEGTPVTSDPTDATPIGGPGPAEGLVTLVVWDQFYRGVESEVIDQLNREFEAAHPNVEIERVSKPLEDLNTTVKLALGQPDGPDVAQVNQGRSDMGALVQAGLLLPLDSYADQYRWNERFSTSVAGRNRFTGDGKVFGTGNLYGVSPTAEVVGVYYNKQKFAEHGWTVPQTWAEFTQLLAAIKATGETPIAFGDLDGWNGIHEFSAVQHTLVSNEYINTLVYGTGNASFDTPENRQAAQIVQGWANQGYFTEGFMGISYDETTVLFKSGQGVLTLTGSWLAGELGDSEYDFGFFLLPQATAEKPLLAIGGVGIPYAIRKGTAHADLAAEYLDWMISPRAAELWARAHFLPAMPLPAKIELEPDPLFTDLLAAWDRINRENGVGHYIDWATPTIYDTLTAELQKLYAGESTPEEFTAAVQEDYAAFLAGSQ